MQPEQQPMRPQTPPEVLACLSKMHEMFKQQEALQQQNKLLYDALQELRTDQQKLLPSVLDQLKRGNVNAGASNAPPRTADATQRSSGGQAGGQAPVRPHTAHPGGAAAGQQAQQHARNGAHAQQQVPTAPPADTPGDGHFVSENVYGGAPAVHDARNARSSSPTRAELALLHASGLDTDVAPVDTSRPVVDPDLNIELRDPLTVSSVRVQFLGFAPSNALNAPRALDKVYLRFRFFDFPPTQTGAYLLDSTQQKQRQAHMV